MSASDLQQRLDQLGEGETLKLEPAGREFQGPLVVRRSLVIEGQGATLWATQGPVLSIEADGVELNHLNVEVTSNDPTVDGEAASALKVAPHRSVTLNHISVRGTVIGLNTEEGDWRYPRALHLGTLKPKQLNEFKAKLVVPVPCSFKSQIDGLGIDPGHAKGGPVEITLRVDPLAPGTRLRGDIWLQTALLTRRIAVSGNVLKSDGGGPSTGLLVDGPQTQPLAATSGTAAASPVEVGVGRDPMVPSTLPVHAPPGTIPLVKTIVVSKLGEGQFRTLGEAIRGAGTGTRIHVRPGLYKESLVLDRRLEIVGDGVRADIIIECKDAPCVQMKADYAVVRGLTLRGLAESGSRACAAVSVAHGQLVLEDCDITCDALAGVAVHGATADPIIRHCRIHDGRSAGVLFYDRAEGVLEDCEIAGHALAGIEIRQGANPSVRRCQIHDGRQAGILIDDHGKGSLDGCEVSGNLLAGVEIARGADPALRRCKIHDGQYPGVLVRDDGRGTIEDCEITGNALAGVEVRRGGQPILRRCQVRDGRQGGLLFSDHALGKIEDCDIAGNALAGVTIRQGSTPTFQRCKVHHGHQAGFLITNRAKAKVEACEIFANGGAGVIILTQADPTLRRCQIRDGKLAGVVVADEGLGTLEECDIGGNAFVGLSISAGASPVVRRCQIHRNGDVAVWAHDRAAGHVEDCDLTDNGRAALDVARGCTTQLTNNKDLP